ncbi:TetR/AcrR family transcriptional regulator [Candidatus Acetothermia bacterium]|nr:TetR/AcrR family transcriptional regulator [Candidatus Acetothermia bacterium]
MSVSERRLKEKQERVDRILNGALKVFARRGLKDATVDEIAEAAELGKGTLYYYFASKEDLLEALVMATADQYFKGLLDEVKPGTNLPTLCNQIVDNLLTNYRESPELFRVLYLVLAEPEMKLDLARHAFLTKHLIWLEELEQSAKPLLKPLRIPTKPFVDFIGTHTHGIVLSAVAGRDLGKIKDESARALKAFLR